MIYNKDFSFGIGFETAGSKAYETCKTYRLGCHLFKNGNDLIFRICFLRTKTTTHYFQISKQIRPRLNANG